MRIACIVLALFLALPSPGWSAEAMPSAEPKAEGPADMSWFFARFGQSTGHLSAEYKLDGLSMEEYRTLVRAFGEGNTAAGFALSKTIYPHLLKNPDDTRYAELKSLLYSPEYVYPVVGANAWLLDCYPASFWDRKRLLDYIMRARLTAGVVEEILKRRIIAAADIDRPGWAKVWDAIASVDFPTKHPAFALVTGLAYPRLREAPDDSSLAELKVRILGEKFVFPLAKAGIFPVLDGLPIGWWTPARLAAYCSSASPIYVHIAVLYEHNPPPLAPFKDSDFEDLMRMAAEGKNAGAYWVLHFSIYHHLQQSPVDPTYAAMGPKLYAEDFVMKIVRNGWGYGNVDVLPQRWWDSRRIVRVLLENPNADPPGFAEFLEKVLAVDSIQPEDFARLIEAVSKEPIPSIQAALSSVLKERMAERPVRSGDEAWRKRVLSPSFVNAFIVRGCYWVLGCLPEDWMPGDMARRWIGDPAIDGVQLYRELPESRRRIPALAIATINRCTDSDNDDGERLAREIIKLLPDNRAVVMAVVSRCGRVLKYADPRFRDDDGVVSAAIKEYRCPLMWASARLKRKHRWSDDECRMW